MKSDYSLRNQALIENWPAIRLFLGRTKDKGRRLLVRELMFMRIFAPILVILVFVISLCAFVYVDARHWWPRRRKDGRGKPR